MASSCIACHGKLHLFGPRRNFEYYVCERCGSIQLFPQPSEKDLLDAYAEHYSDAAQVAEFQEPEVWRRAACPYYRSLLKAVADYMPSGPILDYGAGWGALCDLLIKNGYDCRGTELSQKMADYCIARGLPVRHGDFRTIEDMQGHFSGIVMCAVFEHMVNHDHWLQEVHRFLNQGGYFITLHPTSACFKLLGDLIRFGVRSRELPELHGSFAPPWHTALFSIQATKILGERNGFRLVEVRPAPQGRVGGLLQSVQLTLEKVNLFGWALFGQRWPLVTAHIFIFQKL